MAFFEPLPLTQHERLLDPPAPGAALLSQLRRAPLKALDETRLSAALHEPSDPAATRPRPQRQSRPLLERRRTLLSYVAALIDRYGEENVLPFP